MKDFYDVYLFLTKLKDDINYDDFHNAMKKILQKRDSLKYLEDYKEILKEITDSDRLLSLWNKYIQKRKYAQKIKILEIIELLNDFLDEHSMIITN